MRGGPAFAVSLILSSLEPALRAAAELGAWQIISPVSALGRVEVVGGLHEVQEKVRVLVVRAKARRKVLVPNMALKTWRCIWRFFPTGCCVCPSHVEPTSCGA